MAETIEIRREGAVARVSLNRPESHNALTPAMIRELTAFFREVGGDDTTRVIVLTGNGRSFCAGADLEAMRAAADFSFAENQADGEAIFDLMLAVDSCPRPVIGRINGAAIGGGAGLVACCDITVAVERAIFSFSEVRLGIVPAVISPFVLAKIGVGAARELFLTGERFKAPQAAAAGLVGHVVADQPGLDEMVGERIVALLQAAPGAQASAKQLIRDVAYRRKAAMRAETSALIARRRASKEGREGMSSFLEKREPWWRQQ